MLVNDRDVVVVWPTGSMCSGQFLTSPLLLFPAPLRYNCRSEHADDRPTFSDIVDALLDLQEVTGTEAKYTDVRSTPRVPRPSFRSHLFDTPPALLIFMNRNSLQNLVVVAETRWTLCSSNDLD